MNDYIGMSADELKLNREMCLNTIRCITGEIEELKSKIEALENAKNSCEENIKMIGEAEKEVSNIQLTTILKVCRTEKDVYVGDYHNYYSASNWKKTVFYKFEVYSCNAENNDKAKTTIVRSSLYEMTERENLLEDIISNIEEHNVEKIIIDKGVRLSQAKLKNHCSNIEKTA